MSHRQQFKLDTPAKKFFACQLVRRSSWHSGTTYQGNNGVMINLSQVWVQGIMVHVSADGEDLLLDDGTGLILATGVTKIVKDLFICKGMYMMVAGQLKRFGDADKSPTIKVLKIADLSSNPHCEALWMLEVIDAQTPDHCQLLEGKDDCLQKKNLRKV